MSDQPLIVADKAELPVFAIAPAAIALRDEALGGAALIGKVENAAQNEQAVAAHIALRRISAKFEKARKTLKEPLLEAGRQLDRTVGTELLEVEKEIGRLATLTAQFNIAEQRRIAHEQELQRRELARIEAEKQAELRRIADEQAAAERAAREAQEAAERQTAEATNAEQLAAAEAARSAAEAQAKAAAEKAIVATQQVQETAEARTAVEAKPIVATRAAGQVLKTDWIITVKNPYELAKFHPDCVKVEPLLGPIKRLLAEGVTVKGVTAEKIIVAGVRLGAERPAIEV